MNGRALGDCCAGEPPRVGERLDVAPARVVHPGIVAPRTDERRNLVAFEEARLAPPAPPTGAPIPR